MLYFCRGCGVSKPRDADHFHRHSTSRDGLQPQCKDCRNGHETVKNTARRDAGLPRIADPIKMAQHLEDNRVRQSERYHADVLASRSYDRTLYRGNAESVKARKKAYRETHPGYSTAGRIRRMGLVVPTGDNYTEADVARMYAEQLGRCHYCGREVTDSGPLKGVIDHMEPLSLSLDNSALNVVLACTECNSAKHAQPYDVFIARTDRPGIRSP